jgi:hypothetical protein
VKFKFGETLTKLIFWLNIDETQIWQNLSKIHILVNHWLNSNLAKPWQNPFLGYILAKFIFLLNIGKTQIWQNINKTHFWISTS